jgi:hypothetical protein
MKIRSAILKLLHAVSEAERQGEAFWMIFATFRYDHTEGRTSRCTVSFGTRFTLLSILNQKLLIF